MLKVKTSLQLAELDIEMVKGEAICDNCRTKFFLNQYGNPCPSCGSYSLQITGGKEMKVLRLTIED